MVMVDLVFDGLDLVVLSEDSPTDHFLDVPDAFVINLNSTVGKFINHHSTCSSSDSLEVNPVSICMPLMDKVRLIIPVNSGEAEERKRLSRQSIMERFMR